MQKFEDGVKHAGFSLQHHILQRLVTFRQQAMLERFKDNARSGINADGKKFRATVMRHAESLEEEPPDHQYAAISVMEFTMQVKVLENLSDSSRANVLLQMSEELREKVMKALSPQTSLLWVAVLHALSALLAVRSLAVRMRRVSRALLLALVLSQHTIPSGADDDVTDASATGGSGGAMASSRMGANASS